MSAEDEMRPRTREEVQREIDEEIEEQRANWLAMTPAQRLAALDELRDAYCEHECCEWDCKRATDLHWDIQSRALLIIDTDVHTARNDHEP